MYLKGIHNIDGKDFNVYKYSYPLGAMDEEDEESQFLAYFNSDTMELDKFVLTAKSLNITNPFTLYSAQPVTAQPFQRSDMEFHGVECVKATNDE